MTKMLLLIDLQNDFLPGGALAVPEGDAVIPIANALMPHFDLIVATQDWHPLTHKSFAANHPGTHIGDIIPLHNHPQLLWPTHCVQNTPGAQLAPTLDQTRIAHITQKGTNPDIDSYSAFFDNHHARATDLHDFLQSKKVKEIHLLGLATDYCVKATALDARQLDYEVHLLTNACRGVNLKPNDVANALNEMQSAGVNLITSQTIFEEHP